MRNPLLILSRQMGIDAPALAEALGMEIDRVQAALSSEPAEPLRSFLLIASGLGVKMRIVADAPLKLWFSLPVIDELYASSCFRQHLGLIPLPRTRLELRQLIQQLRQDHFTYGQIVKHLEDHRIPTVEGLQQWRAGTVSRYLKKRMGDGHLPLETGQAFGLVLRREAIQRLLVEMCPFDAFASVRYQMQQEIREERLRVWTNSPLPASLRRWILAAIGRLNWFQPHQWGTGEEDAVSARSSDDGGPQDTDQAPAKEAC